MSSRRRKSLSIFRPPVSTLTPIYDNAPDTAPPSTLKKKLRPSSIFSSSPTDPSSPLSAAGSEGNSSTPYLRPRTLQKPTRPSSIFGSFRSLHSLHDEDENLIRPTSQTPPILEETLTTLDVEQMTVLHHGEVQMAGSMFRKKSQYLVLTNSHLLRFKSQSKASEAFADIPSSLGRNNSIRHSRISSGGSQEVHLQFDSNSAISLHNVVAAYKLDDGRPYFTIELAHYDETTINASTMSMQLNDPRESELWLTSIRAAITKSRLTDSMPFGRRAIEHAARVLEQDSDYDPNHFRMFTVVQRATKSGAHSSSDDLGKLMSSVFYLVIGLHKVHLVPLPKSTKSASSTSLSDLNGTSHGLMCLSSVHVQPFDDAFQLGFRVPLQHQSSLYLASASANDIALCVRQAAEFLRPSWLEQPFAWTVPDNLDEALLPVPPSDTEEHQCFERTLIAYCIAYDIDPSKVRYTVRYDTEDAPEFELFEPANPRRPSYTALELLAILRALRYNESFRAISFRGTKLDALHDLHDRFGSEHFSWKSRSGQPINLPRLDRTPLLVQELQCLTLKTKRLRRLDFSDTLSRKPMDLDRAKDPGSGICEAIFPLCLLQLTDVDWISLNGIALSEIDIEYLYAAVCQRACHFRALELARCGLVGETLRISIQGLVHQGETLESLVIAGNPAKLSTDFLAKHLSHFKRVRRLDLSKLQVDFGSDPMVGIELLIQWKLETLIVSGNTLNAQTVDAIAAYLVTPQSDTLRELRMEQCQLTGENLATIMECMATGRENVRELHLFVNENRLEKNHQMLVNSIQRSITPSHLTMQMLEYSNERFFRDLLSAISGNTSLVYLDISRASLPYDAGNSTCEELRLMLETNCTLKELNIAGEQAHLEAVTLGRGLPDALRGLEANRSLEIFHIEHQLLGLPGASALASVLEKNSTLMELYCEDNEISLQAFTTLVNALKKNSSLLYLPNMSRDRAWSRGKVDREVSTIMMKSHVPNPPTTSKSSVKRVISGGRGFATRHHVEKQGPVPGYTEQDVQAAVDSLDQKWNSEIARLQSYLRRNYCKANGVVFEEDVGSPVISRPNTAAELSNALQKARLDRTPTMELDRQLGQEMSVDDLFPLGSALSEENLSNKGLDLADGDGGDDGLVMGKING